MPVMAGIPVCLRIYATAFPEIIGWIKGIAAMLRGAAAAYGQIQVADMKIISAVPVSDCLGFPGIPRAVR
jgi:hypothetical protein